MQTSKGQCQCSGGGSEGKDQCYRKYTGRTRNPEKEPKTGVGKGDTDGVFGGVRGGGAPGGKERQRGRAERTKARRREDYKGSRAGKRPCGRRKSWCASQMAQAKARARKSLCAHPAEINCPDLLALQRG